MATATKVQAKRVAWKSNPDYHTTVEGHCSDYGYGQPIPIRMRSVFGTLEAGDPVELMGEWETWLVRCNNCGEWFFAIVACDAPEWEAPCSECAAFVSWEP